jgi:hypothetical protein
MRGDRERCLEAGMDDYVSKPMKADELFAAVDRVLSGQSAVETQSQAPKPEVDLTNVIEAVDGDMTVVKELIGDFLKEIPKQLDNLRDSIQTADAHHVERGAHSLKGAVANFGAKPPSRWLLSSKRWAGKAVSMEASRFSIGLKKKWKESKPISPERSGIRRHEHPDRGRQRGQPEDPGDESPEMGL